MRTSPVSLPHLFMMPQVGPSFSGMRSNNSSPTSPASFTTKRDVFISRYQPSSTQTSAVKFGQGGSSSTSNSFTTEIDTDTKSAKTALSKWKKKAKSNKDSQREKISGNILKEIEEKSGGILITAKSGKAIQAVSLLEVPPSKEYAMLVDVVSSGESKAKGSGKSTLNKAAAVAKSYGRTHLLLYPYSQDLVSYYTHLGFEPIYTIPDFPNGIYAIPL